MVGRAGVAGPAVVARLLGYHGGRPVIVLAAYAIALPTALLIAKVLGP